MEEGIDSKLSMFRNGTFGKSLDGLGRQMPDYVAGDVWLDRAIENLIAKNERWIMFSIEYAPYCRQNWSN